MERVVHFERDAATCGESALGERSGGAEEVDRRYAIMACSSAKIVRRVLAMYVARLEEDEELEGTWEGA